MSEIFTDIANKLVLPIDYESQIDTQKRQTLVIVVGCILSCMIGFISQSIIQLLVCYLCFVFVAMVLVLPSYESYNKRRLRFVAPQSVKIEG